MGTDAFSQALLGIVAPQAINTAVITQTGTLEIKVTDGGDPVVLQIIGQVDLFGHVQLRQAAVYTISTLQRRGLILDLSACLNIDSAGIATLLSIADIARSNPRRWSLPPQGRMCSISSASLGSNGLFLLWRSLKRPEK